MPGDVLRPSTDHDLLDQQDSQYLRGLPALRSGRGDDFRGAVADVRQAQAAQQSVELLGEHRWGRCLYGHRPNPVHAPVERCKVCVSEAQLVASVEALC